MYEDEIISLKLKLDYINSQRINTQDIIDRENNIKKMKKQVWQARIDLFKKKGRHVISCMKISHFMVQSVLEDISGMFGYVGKGLIKAKPVVKEVYKDTKACVSEVLNIIDPPKHHKSKNNSFDDLIEVC